MRTVPKGPPLPRQAITPTPTPPLTTLAGNLVPSPSLPPQLRPPARQARGAPLASCCTSLPASHRYGPSPSALPRACSYAHLHGKHVVHPVNGRRIPIICDAELVDMSFGTGAPCRCQLHGLHATPAVQWCKQTGCCRGARGSSHVHLSIPAARASMQAPSRSPPRTTPTISPPANATASRWAGAAGEEGRRGDVQGRRVTHPMPSQKGSYVVPRGIWGGICSATGKRHGPEGAPRGEGVRRPAGRSTQGLCAAERRNAGLRRRLRAPLGAWAGVPMRSMRCLLPLAASSPTYCFNT